jgi:hypothetical protein
MVIQRGSLGVEEEMVLLVELVFGSTFLVFPLDPIQFCRN